MTLRCETCAHWQPPDRLAAYSAPCGAGAFPGRVPFDHTCRQHSAHPTPPSMPPSGLPAIVQMWTKKP